MSARNLHDTYLIGMGSNKPPKPFKPLAVEQSAIDVLHSVPWMTALVIPYYPKRTVRTNVSYNKDKAVQRSST